jgi:uncharacterized repeat protein (TIGR01451 family)
MKHVVPFVLMFLTITIYSQETIFQKAIESPNLYDYAGISFKGQTRDDTSRVDSTNIYQIFDRFGNYYDLEDIIVNVGTSSKSGLSFTVEAGIFRLTFKDLYNDTGFGFDDSSAAPSPYNASHTLGELRIEVIKRMFEDLSALIRPDGELPNPYPLETSTNVSSYTYPNSKKIEILVSSIYDTNGILASASSMYQYLFHEQNQDGILSGFVKQYVNTGIDPLIDIIQFNNPDFFYTDSAFITHGTLTVNWFNMQNAHIDLYTNSTTGEFDFYTIMLHEAFHLLGFGSFLDGYGYHYTKFDKHIYLDTTAAITNDSCYNWSKLPFSNFLGQCGFNFLNYYGLDSQAVYTDTIYHEGSSFAHFNCESDSAYLMNANHICQRRTPMDNEISVLQDLGYELSNHFGTGLPWAGQSDSIENHTHGVTIIDDYVVEGADDMRYYSVSNDGMRFGENPTLTPVIIPVADLLANDNNASSLCCFQNMHLIMFEFGETCLMESTSGTLDSMSINDTLTIQIIFANEDYIFRYIPVNEDGERGDITYVGIKTIDYNLLPCNNNDPCSNLICHGDFEGFEYLQQFRDQLETTSGGTLCHPGLAQPAVLNEYFNFSTNTMVQYFTSSYSFFNEGTVISKEIFDPSINGGEKFAYLQCDEAEENRSNLVFETIEPLKDDKHYKIKFLAKKANNEWANFLGIFGGKTPPCCLHYDWFSLSTDTMPVVSPTLGDTTWCMDCGVPDFISSFLVTESIVDTGWTAYEINLHPGVVFQGEVNHLIFYATNLTWNTPVAIAIDNIEVIEIQEITYEITNIDNTYPCIGDTVTCTIEVCNETINDYSDTVSLFIDFPPFIDLVENGYFDSTGTCKILPTQLPANNCTEIQLQIIPNTYVATETTISLPVYFSEEVCNDTAYSIEFIVSDYLTYKINKYVIGNTEGYATNDTIEFSITVENTSSYPLTGLVIQDSLVDELLLIASASDFYSAGGNNLLSTDTFNLAPLDSISLSIKARVDTLNEDCGNLNNIVSAFSTDQNCIHHIEDTAKFHINNFLIRLNCPTNYCNCTNTIYSLILDTTVLPVTYLWSNGDTSQHLSNVCPGIYCLTATSIANPDCYSIACYDVTGASIQDSTSVSSSQCSCSGEISVYPYGGIAPYNYYWNIGETTQTVDSLCPGTYYIFMYDQSGCSLYDSIEVSDTLNLTTSSNPSNCNGISTGIFFTSLANQTFPVNYYWSFGDTTSTGGSLSHWYYNLPAGSYSVTVEDANGCIASGTTTIENNIDFNAEILNQPTVTCEDTCNGNIVVEVYTYNVQYFTYALSDGQIITSSNTTESFTGLCAGMYNLTVSDSSGCFQVLDSFLVETTQNYYDFDITAPYCSPGPAGMIDFDFTGWIPPYSYLWNTTAATQDIYPTQAGTYRITVTDNVGCVDSFQCVINPQVALQVADTAIAPTCEYYLTSYANATAIGGQLPYSIVWNNGETSFELNQLAPGDYYYTVTDAYGCDATGEIMIPDTELLTVSLDGIPPLCDSPLSGSISSYVTGGYEPYSYYWSNNSTTANIDSLWLGTYTVTVVDSIYCSSIASDTFSNLWLDIDSMINGQGCDGIYNNPSVYIPNGEIHIEATGGTPPYEYIWDNGIPVTSLYQLIDSTTYPVTVTDANGCVGTFNLLVSSDQDILLKEHWSMFSSYISPFGNPTIAETFIDQGLESEVVVLNGRDGNVWWPQYGIGINKYYELGEGYQIKMLTEQEYHLKGRLTCPEDTLMQFEPGWNMPGYLRTTSSPVATEYSSFLGDILVVKEEDGLICWPGYGLYQFDLEPGEGYQLYDSSFNSFYYTANSTFYGTKNLGIKSEPVYVFFNDKFDLSTGAIMVIMLPFEFWEEVPETGSEIGILGELGQLAGRAIFEGTNTPIIVYGDDITTIDEEGLAEGERFTIVVYEPQLKNSRSVKVRYWMKGSDTYEEGKISIAGLANNVVERLQDANLMLYPNPSSGSISLRAELFKMQNLQLEVYSLEGKLIHKNHYSSILPGVTEFNIDCGFVNSGIYTMRIIMGHEVKFIKFMIVK